MINLRLNNLPMNKSKHTTNLRNIFRFFQRIVNFRNSPINKQFDSRIRCNLLWCYIQYFQHFHHKCPSIEHLIAFKYGFYLWNSLFLQQWNSCFICLMELIRPINIKILKFHRSKYRFQSKIFRRNIRRI